MLARSVLALLVACAAATLDVNLDSEGKLQFFPSIMLTHRLHLRWRIAFGWPNAQMPAEC